MPKTEEEKAFVLGDIEELIILAILRLDSQAYGVAIQDLLEKATKKTMNVRLLYSTLQSLESNGLIKPIEAGPPPPGEKRARRCYAATVAGKQALKRTAAQRRAWS
jgi:DNA-binding PadR family transcriptional regulator